MNGTPYHVFFDPRGIAEVDEAVGEQLLRLSDAVEVKEEIPNGKSAPKISDTSDAPSVASMTVKELREYASSHEISLGGARTKEEILAAIEGASE